MTSGLVCSMLAMRLTHLDLLLGGQAAEDFGGLDGLEMGEDQGDGLGMFVLNEGEEVVAFGLLQEGKRGALDGLIDLIDDPFGLFLGEALGEQGLGVIPAAFVGIGTGEGQLIELLDTTLRRAWVTDRGRRFRGRAPRSGRRRGA